MDWNKDTPLVIAHRGACGEAPENTLAAFALAVRQGCDMIELDVHLTLDGQVAVCHDASLSRTTNGKGLIREMTAEQLRRWDAGSWFSSLYRGEQVPLLEEVFDAVPASVGLDIELKSNESRMEERLLGLLRKHGRLDSVVLSSFDHRLLHRIKTAEPAIRVGLLYMAQLTRPVRLATDFGLAVHSVHPYYALVEAGDIANLRAHGLHVYAWTANGPSEMRQLVEAGVSGIITDYPSKLRELVPVSRR